MSLKPFTYPFPETRFLHAGPNVFKFKIRYGDSIREEEIEDKEVIIQELEDSIRAVLANMDSLQPFVTEHFTVFPYKSKWERVSHLKFKHGDIILTPYPFVFTLCVEMKWFTGDMPTGSHYVALAALKLTIYRLGWPRTHNDPPALPPEKGKSTDDSPLELVLAEKKAEETTMRKRKLVEEPNSPSRPRLHRAKIETSNEAFSNQKPLKKNKRLVPSREAILNREGETQQEYQDTPVFDASDVQEQESKLEHSLPELVVPPLQHSNPPPPKEPGSSGFFGFLRYFFRKSSQ